MRLRLENTLDSIDLAEQEQTGYGFQALNGLTGLGLPAVQTQWLEGAGDGAKFRGKRVLPRDIDLRLDLLAHSADELDGMVRRLALMLSDTCTLVLDEGNGRQWFAVVNRVGGGDVVYGDNTTGDRDMQLIVTVRAGDPYWTSMSVSQQLITASTARRGMLPKLAKMNVKRNQVAGEIVIDNQGDATAYPVWEVTAPFRLFRAVSPRGEVLEWNATKATGKLILDTRNGTVVDETGANRYANLSAAPRFWSCPPGTFTAEASILDTTTASRISCSWRTRKWMVV